MERLPPRLTIAAREAILRRLGESSAAAVPVSSVLRGVRSELPDLRESDEDLIQQIVMDATDRGLAVHFDGARTRAGEVRDQRAS